MKLGFGEKAKCIIVIEEESFLQQNLVKFLIHHGFNVFAYSQAEHAIESEILNLADAIILDINSVEVYINLIGDKIDKPFNISLIHAKPGLGYFLGQEQRTPYYMRHSCLQYFVKLSCNFILF